MSTKRIGPRAALRRIRDAGTSFEAEIARGEPLSIYEQQRILSRTSSGQAAGRLPVGHHDDSSGRFRVDPDDLTGDEPRIVRFHPDEEATVEEASALSVSQRWSRLLQQFRPVGEGPTDLDALAIHLHSRDLALFRVLERVRDAAKLVSSYTLAGAELGIPASRVHGRVKSANAKAHRRAQRLAQELAAEVRAAAIDDVDEDEALDE